MRRNLVVALVGGLVLLLYLTGCEKTSNMSTQPSRLVLQQDQTVLGDMISQDALFTNDGTILNDGDPLLAKETTAITPRNWGRKIESESHNVTYDQIDDTTVVATITYTMSGKVWIRVERTPTDTIIEKPLSETTIRKVKFIRIARTDTPRLNWKIAEVSVMQGGTDQVGIAIQQVLFFIGTDTISVTDPLNYFLKVNQQRGRWGLHSLSPSLTDSFRIQVTVKSTDPDSDIVVAYRPIWFLGLGVYRRAPMSLVSSVSNGDSTFTRVYKNSWQGAPIGRHNVVVNTLTRQSIYDNAANFSSQMWGIPYIVQ